MSTIQSFNSARIARFGSGGSILRSREALTDDQLRAAAPSIFAEDKHGSRSEKFTHIPTIKVLDGLRGEGFQPYEVRQGGSKDEEKRGYTKHLVRLRRDGDFEAGETKRELILLNAHDGTSSYRLMSGLFRMVCSNGLVIADGEAQCLRIPHKGDIVHEVIEGAYTVIKNGDEIDAAVQELKAVELSPAEQLVFAKAAAELRFEEGKVPVTPDQVNRPRRAADNGGDIWRTFNRAQENLIRGGLGYRHESQDGRGSSLRHTRPVNSIDGDTNLNRALWTLAQGMERLKHGEPASSVIAAPRPAFG
jgi:hypothetical protein